ncbi:MAG: hypothetical protein K5931_02765 [Lachnospiraceae bacterium]|nr:hypothetical protein [Lachnospiraceae bacterium]
MEYMSVTQAAKKWNITERAVRNYLKEERVEGAFMMGKTWVIPMDAKKPDRKIRAGSLPDTLIDRLKYEKKKGIYSGIYGELLVKTAFYSNLLSGNRLPLECVEDIIRENMIKSPNVNLDEVLEQLNHGRAFNYVVDNAQKPLSVGFMEKISHILSANLRHKRVSREDLSEQKPEGSSLEAVLLDYNSKDGSSFEDILDLHVKLMLLGFNRHYGGQTARLILFKECIKNKFLPFVIDEELKLSYYRGIREWEKEKWYLVDTCRIAGDRMTEILNRYDVLL